jgi:hypothetical protein
MERCPNCRARWDGSPSCRRCGMDLQPLIAVEEAAEQLIARAVAQVAEVASQESDPDARRKRMSQVRHDLSKAIALQDTSFGYLLLGFVDYLSMREHLTACLKKGISLVNSRHAGKHPLA